MITATTKMSKNGQVVIPKELREAGKLRQGSQFLIIGDGKNLLLKHVDERAFEREAALLGKLAESEAQLRKGEYTTIPKGANREDVYALLTGKRWMSSTRRDSQKTSGKSKTLLL